jgi:ABC-type multidrug transport system ATPase subunit
MGIPVNTTELYFRDRRQRVLSDGLYLRAAPGTLTAIIGPSGCGKSVLIRLLTGYQRPSEGSIFLGDKELWANYERVRDMIGYVPQAEVMIPELRVAESLDYRLRFRFRDRSPQDRQKKIRETCAMLGLSDLDSLLTKQVGSSENHGGRFPSGGERRRINIAHEILSQPQVLFMDEPTSGLASIEADALVKHLRKLAITSESPVVLTIHSPSRDAFESFHNVIIMGMGGVLAYYGKGDKAADYFQRTTPIAYEDENPAEYVLRCVSNEPNAARVAAVRFRENRQNGRFDNLIGPCNGANGNGTPL